MKDAEAFEKNYKKDAPDRKSPDYLTKKPQKLEELVANFRANHRKLLRLLEVEDPYFAVQEDMQAKFGAIRVVIEGGQVKNLTYSATSEKTPSDQPVATPADNRTASTFPPELPKLRPTHIPLFTGLSKGWGQFINLFKAMIGNDQAVGNIQKLLGYLQGKQKKP